MQLRTFSAVFISVLVPQETWAFPSGPGACGTPAAVGGIHLLAPTVIERTLEDAGITVTLAGVPPSLSSANEFAVQTDVPIVVSATDGLTYRGILIRVERADGIDATGSLFSTDLADAFACSAPVTGVGHSNSDDKTTNSATLRFEEPVDAVIQITVVFSNSDGVSSYAFNSYQVNIANPVVNPPCEICGCSFCTPGEFPVGNPLGVIPIPEEFADVAPPGFTEIPCSLLDFAGVSGQIPPEFCNDDLRLLPEFREICGCPALPPTEAPVASPTEMPVTAPTEAPIVAPTDMPVVAPTEAPVVAPTDIPITEAPVAVPTDMPVVNPTDGPAPTDMPVATPTDLPVTETPIASPTEAPVVATTEMPVPTSTENPVMAPTEPTTERCIRRKR